MAPSGAASQRLHLTVRMKENPILEQQHASAIVSFLQPPGPYLVT